MKFHVDAYNQYSDCYYCRIPKGELVTFCFGGEKLSFTAKQDVQFLLATPEDFTPIDRESLVGQQIDCEYLFDYLVMPMDPAASTDTPKAGVLDRAGV